jgi:hypothetical protein
VLADSEAPGVAHGVDVNQNGQGTWSNHGSISSCASSVDHDRTVPTACRCCIRSRSCGAPPAISRSSPTSTAVERLVGDISDEYDAVDQVTVDRSGAPVFDGLDTLDDFTDCTGYILPSGPYTTVADSSWPR